MESLRQDFRIAVRSLWHAPAFAVAAILTLALGIGAATSVFSVAYGILLSPLPMRDPSRLAVLWAHNPTLQPEHFPLWGEEYKAFRRETQSFSATAIYEYHGAVDRPVGLGDSTVTIGTNSVSGAFFDVLGMRPRIGRLLRPDHDVFGAAPVAVISEGFWRRAFGADPAALGRTLRLGAKEFTIVGVVPGGFDVPRGAQLWTSIQSTFLASLADTLRGFYDVVGRLKPGVTPKQAELELGAFLQRATEPHSGARMLIGNGLRPVARPITEVIVGDVRPAIRIVVGSVTLLLLVTCINIANLQLVRAVGRRREFAVRAALGASRGRIAQQVLIESGVIALAGGALGILVARLAISIFLAVAPAGLPRVDQVGANGPLLAASVALVVGVAILVGILPALVSGRLSLADNLRARQGGDGTSATHRTRSALVAAQVAVTVAVLVAAGVVGRSFEQLMHLDLGFKTDRLLLARLASSAAVPAIDTVSDLNVRYRRSLDMLDAIMARVRALPGVSSSTLVIAAPFQSSGLDVGFMLPGESVQAAAGRAMVDGLGADADYFRTLGIPIRRGRAFTDADGENAARVVIVDETLAKSVWPGQDPLGKQLNILGPPYTVVGIAGETRYRDLLRPRQTIYLPYRQTRWGPSFIAVRTAHDASSIATSLRAAARDVQSNLTIAQVTTLTDRIDATTAQPRLNALLLGGFAISILLLTAVGLYSIAATYVRHREFEIAVRVALGAAPGEVVRLVLGQGAAVVIGGALVGALGALAGAGVLASIIYGVRPRDPVMVGAALAGVGAVALIAFFLPARRASRTNPAEVLRAG
jgi:predicted permease